MAALANLAISGLLRARVRTEDGLDLGLGHMAWMHPPCHRLLGWSTRPSAFGPARNVWRLNQLVAMAEGEVIVRGEAASSDQETLVLLPTLLDAELFGAAEVCLGRLVDAVVEVRSGRILHYLVARSDPRLPGTSRWRLDPDRLLDQQPGQVITSLRELDDLPLEKASIRQQMLRRTKQWRDQVPDSFDGFENRLRSWGDRFRDEAEDQAPTARRSPRAESDEDPWI